jgi:hypothetical protein
MHWDRGLSEYCNGDRAKPAWGISGADFHGENKGVELDTFQTVFLVENRGRQEVMQALEQGRIYSVRKAGRFRLSLDQFQVGDAKTGSKAIMGEEIRLHSSPVVEGRLAATDGGHYSVAISIIRGGKPIWSFEGETPLNFKFVDHLKWSGKTFYRLDVSGKAAGQLLSNPIFVVRK